MSDDNMVFDFIKVYGLAILVILTMVGFLIYFGTLNSNLYIMDNMDVPFEYCVLYNVSDVLLTRDFVLNYCSIMNLDADNTTSCKMYEENIYNNTLKIAIDSVVTYTYDVYSINQNVTDWYNLTNDNCMYYMNLVRG